MTFPQAFHLLLTYAAVPCVIISISSCYVNSLSHLHLLKEMLYSSLCHQAFTLWHMCVTLLRLIQPILSLTKKEIISFFPPN